MTTLYHVLHRCGHAVYWQDPIIGISASRYRCPWCGGEKGRKNPQIPPLDAVVLKTASGHIVRKTNDDGSFPIPANERPGGTETVIVNHMNDDRCCKPPNPWPDGW